MGKNQVHGSTTVTLRTGARSVQVSGTRVKSLISISTPAQPSLSFTCSKYVRSAAAHACVVVVGASVGALLGALVVGALVVGALVVGACDGASVGASV